MKKMLILCLCASLLSSFLLGCNNTTNLPEETLHTTTNFHPNAPTSTSEASTTTYFASLETNAFETTVWSQSSTIIPTIEITEPSENIQTVETTMVVETTETITTTEFPSTNESPSSDFEFIENDTGGVTVLKYLGNDAEVIIPTQTNGKRVTKIGMFCFGWRFDDTTKSVILPNSLISIGNCAFQNCYSLENINLPTSLTEIGNAAFENCTNLKSIVLPQKLNEIGTRAFANCTSLKHVTIPSNCLSEYSWEAFSYSGLETISFEEGLEIIPEAAFAGTYIKEIVLPNSLKEIRSQAFGGCSNLNNVILNNGLEIIGDSVFSESKIIELTIPASILKITEMSFNNCSSLKQLKFEGNAPSEFVYPLEIMPIKPMNTNFTVYYHANASGFSTPEWNGYKTEIW